MPQTIYKYRLVITDEQTVELPAMARILSVGLDPVHDICVWAMVEPDNRKEDVAFRVLGTGNPVPPKHKDFTFLGTVTKGRGVWHVFYQRP